METEEQIAKKIAKALFKKQVLDKHDIEKEVLKHLKHVCFHNEVKYVPESAEHECNSCGAFIEVF